MALDKDYTQTDLQARRDAIFLSIVADQSSAYRKAVTIEILSLKLLTGSTKNYHHSKTKTNF